MGNVIIENIDIIPSISNILGIPAAEFSRFYDSLLDGLMAGTVSAEHFWTEYAIFQGMNSWEGEDLLQTCFTPTYVAGMPELLADLRNRGARVVCGSNTYASHCTHMEEAGIFDHFDKIYASNIMGIAKPDAGFYQAILDAEGVCAEKTFFADDLLENITAAASLGIHAFQFKGRDSIEKLL